MGKIQKLTTYVAVVVDPSRMHGFTEAGDIIVLCAHRWIAWNGGTLFLVNAEDVEIIESFDQPML